MKIVMGSWHTSPVDWDQNDLEFRVRIVWVSRTGMMSALWIFSSTVSKKTFTQQIFQFMKR